MWNKLTIQQAQQIDLLRQSKDTTLEVETSILAVINNVPQSEIDSLSWVDYLKQRNELTFLETPPEGKPIEFVTIGKKRYRFIYDIRQMPFARYIEGKTFSQSFMQNLHKLAASMVVPQKRTFFGWKDLKYDASKHEQYAEDMLNAPFEAVYSSAVFFYHLFRNWIEASKVYLIKEQMNRGMTMEEAVKLVTDLCLYLDGNIPLKPLQNIKESA